MTDLPTKERLEELRQSYRLDTTSQYKLMTTIEIRALLDCALAVRRLGVSDPSAAIEQARDTLRLAASMLTVEGYLSDGDECRAALRALGGKE